jgi:hypothetical protein
MVRVIASEAKAQDGPQLEAAAWDVATIINGVNVFRAAKAAPQAAARAPLAAGQDQPFETTARP